MNIGLEDREKSSAETQDTQSTEPAVHIVQAQPGDGRMEIEDEEIVGMGGMSR